MADKPFDLLAYCDNLAKAGTEHAHQRAFFGWLLKVEFLSIYPDAGMAYAVPNGGKRDAITAARLKAEGVKSGVPDICYPVPIGVYAGLYMELKVGKGSTSDSQDDWHARLRKHHHAVATCWGWRAAMACFEAYSRGEPVLVEYRSPE
jgi:hypothetical protein